MQHPYLTFVWLVAPIILGLVFLALQFSLRSVRDKPTKCHFSLFGLVTIEREIQNVAFLRVLMALLALACFLLPAFRDYTRLFPTNYKVEVFFDDEGVERTLAQFSPRELKKLGIASNWRPVKMKYLRTIDKKIEELTGIPFPFDGPRGAVHSVGEAYFKVRKIKGWQKYEIERAGGNLNHSFELPGKEPQHFFSRFELLPTDANQIEVSLADIYFRYTKILVPEFKQIVSLSPTEDFYLQKLVAVMKIRFFPVIDIGRTIYIAKVEGTQIPIGYALYTAR